VVSIRFLHCKVTLFPFPGDPAEVGPPRRTGRGTIPWIALFSGVMGQSRNADLGFCPSSHLLLDTQRDGD